MKRWLCVILATLTLAQTGPIRAGEDDIASALQKGLFEEEANHNFAAAIDAYSTVIAQFDKHRKLAATAIFRLGECYRKQGKTNEATAQYERVLREFSDQAQLVPLSRQNLASLGASARRETAGTTAAGLAEQKRLLEAEIQLVEKTLDEQRKRANVGAIEPEAIRKTEREILVLQRQLAAIESGTATVTAPGAITSTEAQEVRRIQLMIKDSPDLIDAKDNGGNTPLHYAAERAQLVVAKFLLDSGADPNTRDSNGKTPLFKAAEEGHKAMVELLLSRKADLRIADKGGTTPLISAASRGFKSVLEVLLANGVDVNAPNATGATALHTAAGADRIAIIETLIANGANVNARNRQGLTALHYAAGKGHEAVAGLLLRSGADVNAVAAESRRLTPLAQAVISGHAAVVELLLAHKADPNLSYDVTSEPAPGRILKHEYFPLYGAADEGRTDLVELLLKYKANPNSRSGQLQLTPLMIVVLQNRNPTSLLKYKADPNIPDTDGRTPLHAALALPEVAGQLLAAGANVNATNSLGETPLHWAVSAGLAEMASKLIEHRANPNLSDAQGMTPLHWAAGLGSEKMTALLLARKADPNVADNLGRTPLDLTRQGANNYRFEGGPGLTITRFYMQSGIPNRTVRTAMPAPPPGFLPPQASGQRRTADLLKAAGAVEDMPRYNELVARRTSANYSATAFTRPTNQWNQFSLLELIAAQYRLVSSTPEGGGRSKMSMSGLVESIQALAFPDLGRIRIRRPVREAGLRWEEQAIDLRPLLASGDCSKDVVLEWGDVVEIPEADHLLDVQWKGFSYEECTNMAKCLTRNVQVIIKGQTNKLVLTLDVKPSEFPLPMDQGPNITTAAPFWIRPVLRSSGLLLASSDLTRIKVTRRDKADGETKEWVVDCSENQPAPDLWLRDGDIIEVPDRVRQSTINSGNADRN